jgi:predicted amidohydrolase YtcJ
MSGLLTAPLAIALATEYILARQTLGFLVAERSSHLGESGHRRRNMAARYAIVGAQVHTMDPSAPTAYAVAWTDGEIVAVGTDLDVRDAIDSATHVIDGRGLTVTPGLVDSHQHLFMGAELGQGINFDRVDSIDGLRSRICAERERVGPGGWVQGFAVEYAAFEGAGYHHGLLDDAAGDGPMFLLSLDVHTAFVNEHALRLAGISGPVEFGEGSTVICDDGRPTGELKELPAMKLVMDRIPTTIASTKRDWYRQAIAAQNALGITAVHQMDGSLETLDVLAALEAEGPLDLQVLVHSFVFPSTGDDEVAELIAAKDRAGRRWTADGVKFMLDGVIDTGTAWLEEHDTEGECLDPYWPDVEHYCRRIRRFHDAGFRIATHAIGDRAVREVLDAYAGLPRRGGPRHRIEHIEAAPDALVSRFKTEGVTASMQLVHMRWLRPDLTDPWSQRLGVDRCRHAFRAGDISADGALVVLGSDWPVAPYDPRMGFFAARQRRAHDVHDPRPIGTARPLTGQEVLAGYTRNPALAIGDTASGVLGVGMRADLVAWAEDPVTCAAGDITDLPVVLTASAGRIVHRADSLG